jgi:hypothetical protein
VPTAASCPGSLACNTVVWLRSALGRLLAHVVAHAVRGAEQRVQSTSLGEPLESADLPRIGIDHDVRIAARADGEEAHHLRGVIGELVRALLAARESYGLAFGQLAPTIAGAQAGTALQDNEELLLAKMVVVGVGGLSGRYLPQAQAQPLTPGLTAQSRASAFKARLFARLVEDRIVDIGHSRSVPMSSVAAAAALLRQRVM